MRVAAIITILMVVSSTVSAECYKNARGRTVCSNGQKAGGYNAKTGRLEVREESEWSSYDADERGGTSQDQEWQRRVSESRWQKLLQDSK
jgi:hypothetical protein